MLPLEKNWIKCHQLKLAFVPQFKSWMGRAFLGACLSILLHLFVRLLIHSFFHLFSKCYLSLYPKPNVAVREAGGWQGHGWGEMPRAADPLQTQDMELVQQKQVFHQIGYFSSSGGRVGGWRQCDKITSGPSALSLSAPRWKALAAA